MTSYSGYFKSRDAENTFFAGANTARGFVSDYAGFLSEDTFSKVYIIKGGSGTGKSTMMRRAAEAAEKAGVVCTRLLCGSDPDSLDGVIIEKGKTRIAVIDGTAPHTYDPVYAGACGEIINCGDWWNAELLESHRDEISEIIREKTSLFGRGYRYLAACRKIAEIMRGTARGCILTDKMKKFISRTVTRVGDGGEICVRRCCGFTMKGAVRLDSFEKSGTVYGINDCGMIAPIFTEMLASELIRNGHRIEVSVSPILGISEIRIPMTDTAFVPADSGKAYDKIINISRFADSDALAAVRQKQRFASKCFEAMADGANESFTAAGKLHYRLEDIYVPCMNFDGLNELTTRLCKIIISRL